MTTVVNGLAELATMAGRDLGSSEWLEITQERVNTFADATDDHQWIHIDPQRAAAGPFGAPIAHGYLTLSLVIPLFAQLLTVENQRMAVNYGLNRVRFPSPVKVGARVRLAATIVSVTEVADSGLELVLDFVIQVEGGPKPACVAQAVLRFYG